VVASKLETLDEKEELSLVILVENELEAITRFDEVISVFVTLLEKEPEAVTKLDAVVSVLVSLVEIEPDPK